MVSHILLKGLLNKKHIPHRVQLAADNGQMLQPTLLGIRHPSRLQPVYVTRYNVIKPEKPATTSLYKLNLTMRIRQTN